MSNQSPWGKVQSAQTYGAIVFVSTASHGGYLVPSFMAKCMGVYAELGAPYGTLLAFEEDCRAAAVELAFPAVMEARAKECGISVSELRECAEATIRAFYPRVAESAGIASNAEARAVGEGLGLI